MGNERYEKKRIWIRRWIAMGIAAMMLAPLPAFSTTGTGQGDQPMIQTEEEGPDIEERTEQDSPDLEMILEEQREAGTDEFSAAEEGQPLEEKEPESPVPAAPARIKLKRTGDTVVISWEQEGEVDGFTLCYADNRLFLKEKKLELEAASGTSRAVTMPQDKKVFVRLQSWREAAVDPAKPFSETEIWRSVWAYSKNVITNSSSSVKRINKASSELELRRAAKQKIKGYDTVQGSCYGDGYYYYLLYDRDKNKCKIVKMDLSTSCVTMVSPAIKLYHGNDMTYNSKTGELIIAHASPDGKRLSVANRNTLRIIRKKTVELPEEVPGLTDSKKNMKRLNNRGGYKGFSSIAYNKKHEQYVVQLYLVRDYMILDENFRPIRYIRPTAKDGQLYQGIETCGDLIIQSSSFLNDKKYNILTIYDWDGNYLSKVRLNKGMELESVFLVGKKLYASYYRSYTKAFKKTIKVKKRVKKKVRKKIRKGKNKGRKKTVTKYVTKTVKKKITVWRLQRDGYLYRVKGL